MRETTQWRKPCHILDSRRAYPSAPFNRARKSSMRFVITLLLMLGIACTTTACVVEEPGGHDHHCSFWHPCR
jgi:hypothetical protein